MTTPKRSRGGKPDALAAPQDVSGALAELITSLRPHALCDSCIALDIHVSHAEARAAAVGVAMGEAFERTLRRCHRCARTVEATGARPR